MTQGFDLDEIERLLAAATPEDEWFVVRYGYGDSLVICRDEAGNQRIAFMAVPGGRDHLARKRAWKVIKADAALIVAARNSLPAMITEIRELRAENARLKGAIKPQWFYLGDDQSSDKCRFAPYEVIDEDFFCWGERKAEGAHIVHISTALPGPDIWAVVRVLTEAEKDARDDDEPWIIEEYPTEELARAALGEPQ